MERMEGMGGEKGPMKSVKPRASKVAPPLQLTKTERISVKLIRALYRATSRL